MAADPYSQKHFQSKGKRLKKEKDHTRMDSCIGTGRVQITPERRVLEYVQAFTLLAKTFVVSDADERRVRKKQD